MAGTDPTINNNIVHSYYGAEKGLNLYEANQHLAISVIGANDNMTKYDPRYVRMIAQYYYYEPKLNEDVYTEIPLIPCT